MNKNKFYSFLIYLLSAYCVIGNINFWALYHILIQFTHQTWEPYIDLRSPPYFIPSAAKHTCACTRTHISHTHVHTHLCMGLIGHRKKEVLRASASIAYASNMIQAICRRQCHYHTYVMNEAPSIPDTTSAFGYNERVVLSQQSPLLLTNNV